MRITNLEALTQNSLAASLAAAQSDSWRWGSVSQLDPVGVILDGEDRPIFPSDVLTPVTVNMRVYVRMANGRATVMGADSHQTLPAVMDKTNGFISRPGVYTDGRLDPPAGFHATCNSGMVTLHWSGKLARLAGVPYPPPPNFSHVLVEQSEKETGGEWVKVGQATGGGLTLDRENHVGKNLWFRARSVDVRGQAYESTEPLEVPVTNNLAAKVQNALTKAEQVGEEASRKLEGLDEKLADFKNGLDQAKSDAADAAAKTVETHNEIVEARRELDEAIKTGDNALAEELRGKLEYLQIKVNRTHDLVDSKLDRNQVEEIARTAANGKNMVYYSYQAPEDAQYNTSYTDGDTWFRRDRNANIIGQWMFETGSWIPVLVKSEVIANLDVAKLTAGDAKISEAVIEKLWVDGLNAKQVTTKSLIVETGNLWPDPRFNTPKPVWGEMGWEFETKDGRRCMSCVMGEKKKGARTDITVPFTHGAGGVAIGAYVMCDKQTDNHPVAFFGIERYYLEDGIEKTKHLGVSVPWSILKTPGNWAYIQGIISVPENTTGFRIQLSSGTAPTGDEVKVYIANPFIRPLQSTVTIENGAITAPKLTVNQALIDKLTVATSLWAGKVSTEMLKVGAYNDGVCIDRYGVKVRSGGGGSVELTKAGLSAFQANGQRSFHLGTDGEAFFKGSIKSGSTIEGTAIKGGSIIGASIKTAQSGRRAEISGYSIRLFNGDNSETMRLNDSTLQFSEGGNRIGYFRWGLLKGAEGKSLGVVADQDNAEYVTLGVKKRGENVIATRVWVSYDKVTISSPGGTVVDGYNIGEWFQALKNNNSGSEAINQANAAMEQANRAFENANRAIEHGNRVLDQANAAMVQANKALDQGNAAMRQGNAAMEHANRTNARLAQVDSAVQNIGRTFWAYGFKTANGGQISPQSWNIWG